MIPRWPHNRPGIGKRAQLLFKNRSFSLTERTDPLLVFVLISGALILGVGWLIGVRLVKRIETNPDVQVRPIPDERLITNVRDGLDENPFLDAILHQEENKLYFSQRGGKIHTYDLKDGLWSFEKPYSQTSPVSPPFTMLQAGCGGITPCPENEMLWALGQDGGLVRKVGDKWELVVSDTSFVGADGLPVNQDNLSAAALSEDGIWLALGTKSQGFGLYATDRHRWLRLSPSFYQPLPSLAVQKIVWWQNQFWLGGPNGLAVLNMQDVSLRPVGRINGKIMDLDADPQGRLWVLEQISCATPGQNCQRLWVINNANSTPEIALEEKDRYAELNLARLNFAMQADNHLWLVGETGVYGYKTDIRQWERFHEQPVGTTLALPGRKGFFFGYSGGVGWQEAAGTSFWPLEGERFIKLTENGRGGALGLTLNGGVYNFQPGQDHQLIFSGNGSSLDPSRFTAAVALDDQILFSGPKGAMLHDVRRRTYRDFKDDPGLAWLTEDRGQLVTSGDFLYALGQTGPAVTIKSLGMEKVRNADFSRPFIHPPMVGPITQARAWERGGIGMVDGDGRVVHVDNSQMSVLTGGRDSTLSGETLLDVVSTGRDLLFLTSKGWRNYDQQTRSWSDLQPSPSERPLKEVTAVAGKVYMRDDRNRLVHREPYRPILIGAGAPSSIPDNGLSDVRGGPGGFYMAGRSHVEYYDLGLRSITGRWRVQTGSTQILGQADSQPLTLTDGSASWGDQILGPINEKVTNIFRDASTIWTVRQKGPLRYLRGTAMSGTNASCLFRRPTMGQSVETLTDVTSIGDDGIVIAATNDGLRFYDPRARSWFLGPRGVLPKGGQIFNFGDYLLFLEREGSRDRHWVVARRNIRVPDSCSDDRVQFEASETIGRGTAVDEQRGLFSWIMTNGGVSQWRAGRTREILPPEPTPPALAGIRQWVFQDQHRALFLVINSQLWRYTLANRAWERIAFSGGSSVMQEWNLEAAGDVLLVTAIAANGSLHLGELTSGATSFDWVPVMEPGSQRFGQDGSSIMDVQMHPDGTWVFLLTDRLMWFNPTQRRWSKPWRFPNGITERKLALSFGRWVCEEVESGDWWVGSDNTGTPAKMIGYAKRDAISAALDDAGGIWQLNADGRLKYAGLPTGSRYQNFQDSGPQPFVLPSQSVQQAISWEGLLVFVTDEGLMAYDENQKQTARLPSYARTLRLKKPPMIIDGDLWLQGENLLVVLQRAESNQIVGFRFENIKKLAVDSDGIIWALYRNNWRFWRNGSFQAPGGRQGIGSSDVLMVEDGMPAMAMTPNRELLSWQGTAFDPVNLVLPDNELPQNPWGMAKGSGSTWWAWGPFGLAKLREDTCGGRQCLLRDQVWQAESTLWPQAAADISQVQFSANSGLLIFAKGQLFLPGTQQLTSQTSPEPNSRFMAENEWEEVQSNSKTTADGDLLYNPVLALENQDVSLVAKRPDGNTVLAERGDTELKPGPALNTEWLTWEKQSKRFSVASIEGRITIAAADFVADGSLLFEDIEAVISPQSTMLVVANRHGLWRYKSRQLSLNQPGIEFIQKPLELPIRGMHNAFKAGNGRFRSDGFKITNPKKQTADFGDIILSENEAGDNLELFIAGQKQVFDQTLPGFPWDRNRRGLTWRNGRLQMWSDAGLHDLENFSNFQAMPSDVAAGHLWPGTGNGIWLETASGWSKLGQNGWASETTGPNRNQDYVTNSVWSWRQGDGQPLVRLGEGGQTLAWQKTTSGWAFRADLLEDAIADQQHMLVVSRAWLTALETSSQLVRFKGKRLSNQKITKLKLVRAQGNGLFAADFENGDRKTWDPQQGFQPLAPGSNANLLWENDRIRFEKKDRQVTKSMRLDSGWTPFRMVRGRFPFDIVTSIMGEEQNLLLGSEAGLQIYAGSASLNLAKVSQWQGLGDTNTSYRAVNSMRQGGIGDPIQVRIGNQVFQREQGTWQPLSGTTNQSNRLRHRSGFWEWRQQSNGTLNGRYLGAGGKQWPVSITRGAFAHDQIRDILEAEGMVFSLWRDGHLSVGHHLAVDRVKYNHQVDGSPNQLLYLERDTLGANGLMQRGVYALARSKAWRFEQNTWQPVSDSGIAASLRNYVEAPPIYQREHIRLRREQRDGRLIFEYQSSEEEWETLDWTSGGRLALDRIYGFTYYQETIWAATDLGLVSFSLDGDGRLVLQPHHFQVIKNLAANQPAVSLTDLNVEDGKLWVRSDFDSNKVYSSTMTDLAENSFTKASIDPFANGVFVDGPDQFWQWRWKDKHSGSPGVLEGEFSGEPLRLNNGRFHFDGITSIAFGIENQMEMTTQDGGWFELPRDGFSLSALKRPDLTEVDVGEITSITVGKRETQEGFCLEREDGSYWWFVPGQPPEATVTCNACLADDGFWQYQASENDLRMVPGKAMSSLSQRAMFSGRFLDDVVIGMPVMAGEEGEATFWLPTEAGVVKLNQQMRLTDILPPPFNGLPNTEVPKVIVAGNGASASYVGADGFYTLDSQRSFLSGLPKDLENAAAITSAQWISSDSLRLGWKTEQGHSWHLLAKPDLTPSLPNHLFLNIAQHEYFLARRLSWSDPQPWVVASYQPGEIVFTRPDSNESHVVAIPQIQSLLRLEYFADKLFVLGTTDMIELRLEGVMDALFGNPVTQAKAEGSR